MVENTATSKLLEEILNFHSNKNWTEGTFKVSQKGKVRTSLSIYVPIKKEMYFSLSTELQRDPCHNTKQKKHVFLQMGN